jgi:hypothetical protein
MTITDILKYRLHNQQISRHMFEQPKDVVAWLGAVQAQDYLNSMWAIGLRIKNAAESDIEKAIADKTIVRTWPMRRTLHFVAAEDIRWMLELLTPRVIARCATMYKQAGLDDKTFAKSKKLFTNALQDGRQLTRNEMYQVLEQAKVSTASQRGLHILAHHAQKGLICFGARQRKQQTFVLLDEWIPATKKLKRDEALAELTKRYFFSHGLATIQDCAWWSGLTVADIKSGLEMIRQHLRAEVINKQTYWMSKNIPDEKIKFQSVYLLPYFDEYLVAYKDRSAAVDSKYSKLIGTANGIFNPVIVINGKVAGTWKRVFKKDMVVVEINPFMPLTERRKNVISIKAKHYGKFLKMPAMLSK